MESIYPVNGVELCAETFGDPADPAVLLIHGASASMLWWPERLCAQLAGRGRYVIRYDQRDTGRSTSYPPGRPGYSHARPGRRRGRSTRCPGHRAGPCGRASMSGGVALVLGVDNPTRVASVISCRRAPGPTTFRRPRPTCLASSRPAFTDHDALAEYVVRMAAAEMGPQVDVESMRDLVRRDIARARDFEASLTNPFADGLRRAGDGGFGDLSMPVLVIHGELDPLLPLAHGEAIRDAVPGASLGDV